MVRKYQKNPNVDMTGGRCCCKKYDNYKGSRNVQIFDMIFIANLPRWIFAIWAKVDEEKWPIYGKVRFCSFFLFWGSIMLVVIIITASEAIEQDETSMALFINALLYMTMLCFAIMLDYHFTRVVLFQAKIRQLAIEKKLKAENKKGRAEQRYRRHSVSV